MEVSLANEKVVVVKGLDHTEELFGSWRLAQEYIQRLTRGFEFAKAWAAIDYWAVIAMMHYKQSTIKWLMA